ncbi:radical SAM protein [Myxococcota bacterium]|nr:radical SAM protein [Myxococcota bacterium]
MRDCGVLQVEPTDFCNLTCPMCHPQQGFRTTLHGGLRKGFMDVGLFRRIVDGIARSDVRFDHLIFQWLGDPSLHPGLEEMLAYAIDRAADRFGYFRIDTNAVILTPGRVDRIVEAYARRPGTPVLLVFSIDAASPETYVRVKGKDAFHAVLDHVRYFLERRGRLDLPHVSLNCEFQFVLQEGNHHEARRFVEFWDETCARGRNGIGWNEVMIKRLSVGTGGPAQDAADRLYEETVRRLDLRPYDKPHVHVKLWEQSFWRKDAGDAAGGRAS